jgi:hypothetical protein
MADDIKNELIDKETVDQAVGILKTVISNFSTDEECISYKEKRSGKERRKDLLMPYWRAFVKKMLENFSSAKMLIFFLPLWASIFFLWILFGMRDEYLEFAANHPNAVSDVNGFFQIAMNGFISWCTSTVSLGGTVIVVRETFKVQKLKALTEESEATTGEIKDMQD